MFEIGSGLGEARVRRGLDLAQVEAETRIRAKYLSALEEERFDSLPETAYVKGFLRTYANYLGLDGERFVEEYDARFPPAEEPIIAPRPRRPRVMSNVLVLTLASTVAVAALIAAWQLGSDNGASRDPLVGRQAPRATETTAAPEPAEAESDKPRPRPKVVSIRLTAARGDCWLAVHTGSGEGQRLYRGILEQGQTIRFRGKRLWIRLGWGRNLDVTLNGRRVEDFPTGTATIVVTPGGVRTVS